MDGKSPRSCGSMYGGQMTGDKCHRLKSFRSDKKDSIADKSKKRVDSKMIIRHFSQTFYAIFGNVYSRIGKMIIAHFLS